MSIQHFAAAPGQIISFLLSCCVKSPAARSTLLIAGGEEPRRAALLPSEAERGVAGGGRGAAVRSALSLFLRHLSLLCRQQVCFSSGRLTRMRRFAVKSELRCAAHDQSGLGVPRSAVTSQSEVNAVKTFGHFKVNVEHINGDENNEIFIYPPPQSQITAFCLYSTGHIRTPYCNQACFQPATV